VESEKQITGGGRNTTRRLARYALPYGWYVALAVLFLLGTSVLQVAGPLLSKIAIDRYLAPAPGSVLPWLEARLATNSAEGLIQICMIYAGVLVIGLLLDFSQQYLMQWVGQRAMFDVRRDAMSRLQELDLAYYDRNPVGRLVTRVTTDVDALNEMFATGIVTMLGDVLVLAFILATMLRLSPKLTLLLLAVAPLVVLATMMFRRAVQAANRRVRTAVARINSFLQEHIAGMSVLQLFNREPTGRESFDEVNREHMDAYKESIHAYGWFYPVVEFISIMAFAGLLAWGGYQVRNDSLSLGVMVAFFQYGMRVFRPIQDLSEKYNILQTATAAAERIFELLDNKPRINAPETPRPFPEAPHRVEFDGVWFAYKDEDWVLKDISFTIEPGETVAAVGHTGAGKTTLASLLLRFHDVQRGSIRVGGIDIRELDPKDLRRHFGVVLQDPHLFTGTIGGNIRLGTRSIDDKAVETAADQVNLLDFVSSLPRGFDHEVKERGAGLSTGQKQLISFARALAHNPRFLILDEATSSVDTETEMLVREALAKLVEGRTSLVIAHRLSTIQRADRILVMHKGGLREQGNHQELLAMKGVYWKLYQLQYQDQDQTPMRPA
jgi:ATP-binding cassette subfamily B protein